MLKQLQLKNKILIVLAAFGIANTAFADKVSISCPTPDQIEIDNSEFDDYMLHTKRDDDEGYDKPSYTLLKSKETADGLTWDGRGEGNDKITEVSVSATAIQVYGSASSGVVYCYYPHNSKKYSLAISLEDAAKQNDKYIGKTFNATELITCSENSLCSVTATN